MMWSFAEFLAEASEKDPYGFHAHNATLSKAVKHTVFDYGPGHEGPGAFEYINHGLHTGNQEPEHKRMVRHMDKATSHPIKKPLTMWRGIGNHDQHLGNPPDHGPPGEVVLRRNTRFKQGKTTKMKLPSAYDPSQKETYHVTDLHVIGHEFDK